MITNISLENIQRSHYLLSSLSREPHKLLYTLPVKHDNFEVAWHLLFQRYNTSRPIANEGLLSLQSATKESSTDLIALLNHLISHHHTIESQSLYIPLHDVLLSQLVLGWTYMGRRTLPIR